MFSDMQCKVTDSHCCRGNAWWRHQMETFPRHWPFVRGIHWSPVKTPYKGQWRGSLVFSLICAWMNGWVNNRVASDLRRHRAHYGVTVMVYELQCVSSSCQHALGTGWPGTRSVWDLNTGSVEVSSLCSVNVYTIKPVTFVVFRYACPITVTS